MNQENQETISPIAEYVTLIIGALSLFILFTGLNSIIQNSSGFGGLAGLIALVYHGILMLVGAPWMLRSTKRRILTWHSKFMTVLAIIQSLIVVAFPIILPGGDPIAYVVFGVIALFELFPILLLKNSNESM